MDKTIAMQVIFWWGLAQFGSWLFSNGLRKSAWGTRYRTEKVCTEIHKEMRTALKEIEQARLTELRKIRVLLIQVALRQGIDVESLEEVIK